MLHQVEVKPSAGTLVGLALKRRHGHIARDLKFTMVSSCVVKHKPHACSHLGNPAKRYRYLEPMQNRPTE
jgi:hypothetical protein